MTGNTREVAGVSVVDIGGRIVLGKDSGSLLILVRGLLSKGHRNILLNLANVNYIDSTGLGCLVSAFKEARGNHGELKLLNLTKRIKDLMQITKLNQVFEILDDEETAIKSFFLIAATAA